MSLNLSRVVSGSSNLLCFLRVSFNADLRVQSTVNLDVSSVFPLKCEVRFDPWTVRCIGGEAGLLIFAEIEYVLEKLLLSMLSKLNASGSLMDLVLATNRSSLPARGTGNGRRVNKEGVIKLEAFSKWRRTEALGPGWFRALLTLLVSSPVFEDAASFEPSLFKLFWSILVSGESLPSFLSRKAPKLSLGPDDMTRCCHATI